MVLVYIPVALVHRASGNAIFRFCEWLLSSTVFFRALPVTWMDESTVGSGGLLRKGEAGMAYGPRYLDRGHSKERIELPELRFCVFERARVSTMSSSVVLGDARIIIERALGPDRENYRYSGAHILAHDARTAVVQLRNSTIIEKGIFLGGNGSSNYYHWLVEILAKLEFVPQLPGRYADFPLLVSEAALRIPSFRQTLGVFAKGRAIEVLSPKMLFEVGELVYISAPSNLPFNLFGKLKFKCAYALIDARSIDYIRRTALAAALALPAAPDSPQKLFLCRKGELRNYNQDEVFAQLLPLGFTRVFMEDLDFLEQVRTIHNADVIAGPTGTAWTNLIFGRRGAKGLCWMAEESGDFSAYSSIAETVGVELVYLTYSAGVHSTRELHFRNYRIDPEVIRQGLAAIGELREPGGAEV